MPSIATKPRPLLVSAAVAIVAALFLFTGVTKVVNVDYVVKTFPAWPYPHGALVAIGLVELVGATLIVIPATRLFGALTLGAVMAGASAYHVAEAQPRMLLVSLPLLAACVLIATFRRPPPK